MGYMHILIAGAVALAASALTSGTVGQFVPPLTLCLVFLIEAVALVVRDTPEKNRSGPLVMTMLTVGQGVALLLTLTGVGVGAWLLMVGIFLNALPQLFNGGLMPTLERPAYLNEELDPDTTWFWPLSDIFKTTFRGHPGYFSAGDAVQVIGMWVFTAELWFARF